jgi:excisionase family DNA binding protein
LAKPAGIKWSKSAQEQVQLLTVPGAAEILDCSEMHVYRQIARGELRAVDIATPGAGRSKTRVRSDDLADYIDRKTRGRAS